MNCPSCESRNTKSCAAVYEQGSRWGRYQTLSEIAIRCAPPAKKEPVGLFGGLLLFVYFLWAGLFYAFNEFRSIGSSGAVYEELSDPLAFRLIMGAAVLVFVQVLIAIPRAIYNRTVWPSLTESWRSDWICLRCGKIFKGMKIDFEAR